MQPTALNTDTTVFLSSARPVHFVGIGGIGMSGLAKLLLEQGFTVSGSDLGESASTRSLQEAGATVFKGHSAECVPPNAVVVATTAVKATNPEIARATELGLPVLHRSEVLRAFLHQEPLAHRVTIGISGSHGKTTTTGMVGTALTAAAIKGHGHRPTIIAGGKLPGFETNAVLGEDRQVLVAELDESDGTLTQYQPSHSVILNLELDHPDHYAGGIDEFVDTFRTFLSGLAPQSVVVFNMACPQTRGLYQSLGNSLPIIPILVAPGDIFTGKEPEMTYNLKNAREFEQGAYLGYVYKKRKMLGELVMGTPGMHQIFNGLVAIALGDQLGIPFEPMAEALTGFTGMGRRFERLGVVKGATLVDDYAHHPTEVRATIRSARDSMGGAGKLVAVFQPHRYSRLKALWEDFVACFEGIDELYLCDVYAAGEAPLDGVTGEAFAKAVSASGTVPSVYYVGDDFTALRTALKPHAQPLNLLITMGAGSVTSVLRDAVKEWQP